METSSKMIDLEDRISKVVFNDNKRSVRFDYKSLDQVSKKEVFAYTHNTDNGETFILKVVTCDTFESGLMEILKYVENHKKTMSSFTVNWSKKGEGVYKPEVSYFYCEDMVEVMSKFFNGKDRSDYIIYEVKLNPIS